MADYVPIPTQTVTPDPMKSLSGMLNMASTVQGMQARNLAMTGQDQQNQSNAITLGERKGMQQVLSDPSQWQNPDGSTDYNRLIPQVMKVAPTTGMDFIGKIAQTEKQATDAKQTIMNLDTSKRNALGQIAQSLQGQPTDTVTSTLDAVAKQSPELGTALPFIKQVISHAAKTGGQPAQDAALGRLAQMSMTPLDQQTYNTPNGVQVQDNQHAYTVNTKPGIAGTPQGAVINGSGATMQPPPTTPVMGGADGRTPGIMGPSATPAPGQIAPNPGQTPPPNSAGHASVPPQQQRAMDADRGTIYAQELAQANQKLQQAQAAGDPAGVARAQQDVASIQNEIQRGHIQMPAAVPQAPNQFVATGRPVGSTEANAANVAIAQNHFAGLAADTANAAKLEGIANNIKAYAPKAIAGTESEKLGFFNGILSQLGSDKASSLKEATDLLQKNMAQLTVNSKAGSDAQQTLLQMAQPHPTMEPKAISEAADQIIGQVRANKAAFGQFLPEANQIAKSGDPSAYLSKLKEWNDVADPRVWQYENLPANERKAFMQNLPASDRAGLIKNAGTLTDKYGLFK